LQKNHDYRKARAYACVPTTPYQDNRMNQDFIPANDIEEKLLAAQEGKLPGEAFMDELLQSQLFMPILDKHGIGGLQPSQSATPLSITAEDGTEVLILFTSPDRAKEFLRDFPGYEGGLLAEFTWILEKLGSGHGISINPNWSVGIDMAPEMIEQLRQAQ